MASTNLVPEILQGQVKPDEPTAVAVIIDNQDPQTAGKILSVRTGNQEKAYIDNNGTGHFAGVAGMGASGMNATGLSTFTGTQTAGDLTPTVIVDTPATVSGSNQRVLSVRTNGSEKVWANGAGQFIASGVLYAGTFDGYGSTAILRGNIPDGATAIANKICNGTSLTTAGAKIASFYSDNTTTERAFINKDGVFVGPDAFRRTPVADAAYTSTVNDNLIAYTSLTAARTVTLTHPQDTGHVIVVKDEAGTATGTVTITVTDSGGTANMQGAANQVINSAFGSVRLYWNGSKWMVW